MENLKNKTVSGLTWSFIDNISVYGIQFIIGIILARLLTPKEFGLIGMIIVFIAISRSIIDSGFTQAIIRKNDATQTDYATIFYFNLAVSVVLYFILFLSSKAISSFYNEPKLIIILKILGLVIIINAFAIVQRARLTKRIDFKLQTKISIIASLISGIISIVMAFKGFGVWSLVAKMLLQQAFTTLFLWLWNKWKPTLEFSMSSFKEMFSFGSKLLISGLIATVYKNIYKLIIGKFFSATELGYYTRAEQFRNLPSQNLTLVVQRVSYPVLSIIQNDLPRLKESFRKLIKSTMLITFILMLLLVAIAKPLILTLVGEKWISSVIYLQLLCFAGMLYPLHAINLNMLNIQGRSDLFLKLEIIKKIMAIPIIIIGVLLGIKVMIVGLIFNSIIAYFLNSYYSGRLIGYSSFAQLKDIMPSFFFSFSISCIVFGISLILHTSNIITLIIQIGVGLIFFFGVAELFKMRDYLFIKELILEKVKSTINAKKK